LPYLSLKGSLTFWKIDRLIITFSSWILPDQIYQIKQRKEYANAEVLLVETLDVLAQLLLENTLENAFEHLILIIII